jgi:CheY-like chemotaxis protein
MRPGTSATLTLVRDGRVVTLPVKLAERPQRDRAPRPTRRAVGLARLAARPRPCAARRRLRARYHVPDSVRGVVVWRVDAVSPALDADIERGDVILEIDRRPIRSVDDYDRAVASARPATCWPSTSTSRAWTSAGSRPSASTTPPGARRRAMKPRILVIDDEGAIRDSLRMILEYEDYQFVGAASGQEGLALAQRERPTWCCSTSRCRAWTAWRCCASCTPSTRRCPS